MTVKRDVVWELKYWGLRTLNNDKFELMFNTMNKKYLPLMYSFVFCRVFIVLVYFRLRCVTTVTPFRRPAKKRNTSEENALRLASECFIPFPVFIIKQCSSVFVLNTINSPWNKCKKCWTLKWQEILKNLQAAHSLSPPSPPPLFLSSSWFPVTCYGQFALPVCKELNVCMQLENLVCL